MSMSENRTSAAEAPPNSGKWIAQLVAGVILAEGIWGFLVSLTNDLLVPLLARETKADPQSPLYLGKGEFDVAGLFRSGLAFCLAGIVFVLLHEWSRKRRSPVPAKNVRVTNQAPQSAGGRLSIAVPPNPVPAPTQTLSNAVSPPQISHALDSVAAEMSAPQQSGSTRPPSPSVVSPKATKPKPSKKEVYYNIVGEPVNPTEED
jgi:hypothetical protein